MQFRPVGGFDGELLGELHRRCFTAPWDRAWSARSFAEILALPGAAGLIAAAGDEPLGFGLTLQAVDEVELLLLAILPERRGQGLAKELLARLLDAATAKGARRAFLEVAVGNAAAIGCYVGGGFQVSGRRKHYYPGGVDALMFEKPLELNNI
ncbi:GNAT family N-acetyltransferase [Dongia sp.]|uniref:GNAT family N-acetyltransferase n=1 Tax=Dongia sp. TaxID=1977262 RepID=UPI0035B2AD6C